MKEAYRIQDKKAYDESAAFFKVSYNVKKINLSDVYKEHYSPELVGKESPSLDSTGTATYKLIVNKTAGETSFNELYFNGDLFNFVREVGEFYLVSTRKMCGVIDKNTGNLTFRIDGFHHIMPRRTIPEGGVYSTGTIAIEENGSKAKVRYNVDPFTGDVCPIAYVNLIELALYPEMYYLISDAESNSWVFEKGIKPLIYGPVINVGGYGKVYFFKRVYDENDIRDVCMILDMRAGAEKFVYDVDYEDVKVFDNKFTTKKVSGYAAKEKNGKWSIYDRNLQLKYSGFDNVHVETLNNRGDSNTFAIVTKDGKYNFIDTSEKGLQFKVQNFVEKLCITEYCMTPYVLVLSKGVLTVFNYNTGEFVQERGVDSAVILSGGMMVAIYPTETRSIGDDAWRKCLLGAKKGDKVLFLYGLKFYELVSVSSERFGHDDRYTPMVFKNEAGNTCMNILDTTSGKFVTGMDSVVTGIDTKHGTIRYINQEGVEKGHLLPL